jgi:hypothetical protein
MKKTITIDAKQYRAAYKKVYGKGRAATRYERNIRTGMAEVDFIIKRLSEGWTFDGQWNAPQEPKQ